MKRFLLVATLSLLSLPAFAAGIARPATTVLR